MALTDRYSAATLPGLVTAALLLGASVALSRPAAAQDRASIATSNPLDRRQQQLAARVARSGRKPEGIVPLLALWRNWDGSSPDRTVALLRKLASDRRLSQQRRLFAQTLLAQSRIRTGDVSAIESDFDRLGYVRRWRVIGPFDNEGKLGFDTETQPEARAAQPADLEASYQGKESRVGWKSLPDVVRYGYISFDSVFRPYHNACALADTYLHSDRARPLDLWLGAGGAIQLYWNGERVFRDERYRRPSPDRSVVRVGAHRGYNRLLVKVCVTDTRWGFFLRVADERGRPLESIRADTDAVPAPAFEKGHGVARLGAPSLSTLAALERAVEMQSEDPDTLEQLARYLAYTGSDDPAEQRARQLAARAAEIDPTVDRLRLAVELAEQRGEKMRFAEQMRKLWSDHPESALVRATVTAQGPVPEDALPMLESVAESDINWFEATRLRAAILRDLGLVESAYRLLAEANQRIPETAAGLRALAEMALMAGHDGESIAARQALLGLRNDDLDSHRMLIADALDRDDGAEVLRHADMLKQLLPGSTRNLRYLAEVYDGLGRDDLVLASYREAIGLAPGDVASWIDYGRALLRADNRDGAVEAFRTVLRLKPQDAETRELLEQLEQQRPQSRRDEAYAIPAKKLLKQRSEPGGYPSEILQDLTVKTVYDNGLGSSFHQVVVRVDDSEGARNWRTYSIQFDPDSQRVEMRLARVYRRDGRILEAVQTYEQQLGQPWYRLYYDTRVRVVVFPDLEPGDVVELRYRRDDVAHRNLFADYFGDLTTIQETVPKARFEYVLISSGSRKFFFNQPELPGLRYSETMRDAQRIHRFQASGVPAIHAESGMPGMTEISPYIHVSTYRDWQQVGRWYWGLIRDQLYADEALERRVAELLKGATEPEERVRRIHDWVVRNTRYVGLEFGIHGYLPYRVPLVIQRGFGDCKDKASVMVTMLREAGIEARMVLVRTRANGAIADRPASLAAFDHVIVYVPSLDLYLDGTAEHSGSAELPVEDQGVMVLLVGPEGAELRRTPVFDAVRNRRQLDLRVRLSADGEAQLQAREQIRGAAAAEYRDTYQAPGTREERFERSLASIYPGAELISLSFDSLEELDRPVELRYRARVPQMARRDGDELRLAPSVLNDLLRNLARSPSRRYPLDLGAPRSYLEERRVALPAGMRATDLPAGGEAVSEFGRLKLTLESGEREVRTSTLFEINRERVSAEQYPAFRRWVEEADMLLRQSVGVVKR